jgi:hypothetical protein
VPLELVKMQILQLKETEEERIRSDFSTVQWAHQREPCKSRPPLFARLTSRAQATPYFLPNVNYCSGDTAPVHVVSERPELVE